MTLPGRPQLGYLVLASFNSSSHRLTKVVHRAAKWVSKQPVEVWTKNWRQLKKRESHSVVFNFLPLHGLYSPWNSLGQNTGVGSLSFLQGIFPAQGFNPGLLHCGWILYQLSYKGSPRILEWVDFPFFRGSSRPRNRTGVSCIAGGFFSR